MFGFLEAFLVLMFQLDKIFNKIFDFLMLLTINMFQMIDFALFLLQVISDPGVLIFIGLELVLQWLIFTWQLVDESLDFWDFTIDLTVSSFVITNSFLDSFQLKYCLLMLWVQLLLLIQKLLVLLHQVKTFFT